MTKVYASASSITQRKNLLRQKGFCSSRVSVVPKRLLSSQKGFRSPGGFLVPASVSQGFRGSLAASVVNSDNSRTKLEGAKGALLAVGAISLFIMFISVIMSGGSLKSKRKIKLTEFEDFYDNIINKFFGAELLYS